MNGSLHLAMPMLLDLQILNIHFIAKLLEEVNRAILWFYVADISDVIIYILHAELAISVITILLNITMLYAGSRDCISYGNVVSEQPSWQLVTSNTL